METFKEVAEGVWQVAYGIAGAILIQYALYIVMARLMGVSI